MYQYSDTLRATYSQKIKRKEKRLQPDFALSVGVIACMKSFDKANV